MSRIVAKHRGFSLAEFVLVVALIGIASAIALPRYGSALSNYRVAAGARRLASDLAYAQSLAKAASTTQSVNIGPGGSGYQLVGVADPDHPGSAYNVYLAADPYQTTINAISLSSSGGSVSPSGNGYVTLSFNGYGIPSAGGTMTLRSGGAQKTITIDSSTCAVTIGS
jgi:prepilin-type N-terminal cleavage/methylation domain-containing protein